MTTTVAQAPATVGRERYEALDSLRGLAALVVVADHCLMTLPSFSDTIMRKLPPPASAADPLGFLLFHTPLRLVWTGYSSVALFFVLSGFVLALPWAAGRPPRALAFALRRFCRIYLPYLAAVAIAMALCQALFPPRPAVLTSQWLAEANWVAPPDLAAIRDHLLMTGGSNTYDNVVWSLVHEMRISLLYPVLMLPLLRFGPSGALATGAALALAATLAGRWGAEVYAATSPFSSLQYAALFLLGSTVAAAAPGLRRWLQAAPGWAAWLILAAGLLLLGQRMPVLPTYALGLGGALVIVAALAPGPIGAFLHRRWLRALGRISYSLYLIHLPVLLSLLFLLHGRLPQTVILLLVPPVSLWAARGFNRLVEEPCMRLGHGLTARLAGPEAAARAKPGR